MLTIKTINYSEIYGFTKNTISAKTSCLKTLFKITDDGRQ